MRDVSTWLWAFDLGGLLAGVLIVRPWRTAAPSFKEEFGRWLLLAPCLALLLGAVAKAEGGGRSDGFFILRLAGHAGACVLVPLALLRAGCLWRARRRVAIGFALFASITAGGWTYANFIEPLRLEITRHELRPERLPKATLRIALLADLQTDHFGDFEARVLRRLAECNADIVLIAGDLLQIYGPAREPERQALCAAFAKFAPWPRLGVFAVDGDVDRAEDAIGGTRVQTLVDDWRAWPAEGLQVLGLSLPASRRPLHLEQLERIRNFDGLSIVLGHAPDFALNWIEGRDQAPVLALAGHTHGGQVCLPFFGPPITLTKVPRSVAAGELTKAGATWIRVSRGTGLERGAAPRVRFLCRPEIVVFDIPGS